MDNKFVLFCSKSDWFKFMFYDVLEQKNFYFAYNGISPFGSRGVVGLLNKILYSKKIERIIKLPKFIKKAFYPLLISSRKLNCQGKVFMIFTDSNRLSHDEDFIQYCKKKIKNLVVVRWFLDLMDISLLPENEELSFCKRNFDIILDYDKNEALKYGFDFIESPYSYPYQFKSKPPIYDVVFVGTAKIQRDGGLRYAKIISAYERLIQSGLSVKFFIFGVPDELKKPADSIVYNQYLPYEKVIELDNESKCILEITQNNEAGTTLRLFESIVFKKKLLIDNVNIMHNALFDSANMKLFKHDEPIDINFIKGKYVAGKIDKESISPKVFFDNLVSIYNNKRRNNLDE